MTRHSASSAQPAQVAVQQKAGKLRSSFATLAAQLSAFALSLLLAASPAVQAKSSTSEITAAAVELSALPAQAQTTHRLILSGGPFPYDKDGVVFGNRERQLPAKPRGHYREYTVKTPGSKDRGARRIVCGGEQPKAPEVCYYTADHYASFKRIAQ